MQKLDAAESMQDMSKKLQAGSVDKTIAETNAQGKSPFEGIPRIKLNISTEEIVEILHECRAGTTDDSHS